MEDKSRGLYKKYEVKKVGSPKKQVDAIVLEFDDPIARKGIEAWAVEMRYRGFEKVYAEAMFKLKYYEATTSLSDLLKRKK